MAVTAALRVRGATKRFGETTAVLGADLTLERGHIHALVGENGAGKSTLSSIAAGLLVPDEGFVEVFGERLAPHTPATAAALGVGMVQQHFRLVETMTVLENAMLGAEPRRRFGVDLEAARRRFDEVVQELGVGSLDPERLVGTLGVGDRQRLEVLRVLFRRGRVLLLDEPTAVLTPAEAERLYETLARLVAGGCTVLVVTHKLDEVFDHAHAVSIMRHGRMVSTRMVSGADRRAMLRDAFDDDVEEATSRAPTLPGTELLVQGALAVKSGEVVGIAGVEGNGQRELVEGFAGLGPPLLELKVHARVDVVHEDRHERGLVLDASLADNAVLGELDRFTRPVGLDLAAMTREATARVNAAGVAPNLTRAVRALSGGNQQKVVVARALARGAGRRVLVLAQPTRGVDVAAARAIHARVESAAADGAAVLVLSASLDELRALSHRIVVLRNRRFVAEVTRDGQGAWGADASNERLGAWMVGGTS